MYITWNSCTCVYVYIMPPILYRYGHKVMCHDSFSVARKREGEREMEQTKKKKNTQKWCARIHESPVEQTHTLSPLHKHRHTWCVPYHLKHLCDMLFVAVSISKEQIKTSTILTAKHQHQIRIFNDKERENAIFPFISVLSAMWLKFVCLRMCVSLIWRSQHTQTFHIKWSLFQCSPIDSYRSVWRKHMYYTYIQFDWASFFGHLLSFFLSISFTHTVFWYIHVF